MKKKAFTLIELIVVISIISTILSIIVIRIDLLRKIKEKNEIKTIDLDLKYCKDKARVTGVDYNFSIEDKNTYFIRRAKIRNGGGEYRTIIKKVQLETLKFLNVNKIEKRKISFLETGAVDKGQTIIIKARDCEYELLIGVAGASIRIIKK